MLPRCDRAPLIEMGIEPFLVGSAVDCVVTGTAPRGCCARELKKRVTLPAEVMRANVQRRPRVLRARRLRALRRQRLQGPRRPLRGHVGLGDDPLARRRARARRDDRRAAVHEGSDAGARGRAPRRSAAGSRRSPRSPGWPAAGRAGGRRTSGPVWRCRYIDGMNFDFSEILLEVVAKKKASDLHIRAGAPPMLRVRGSWVEGMQRLTATDTREIVYAILNSSQRQRLETDWQHRLRVLDPRHARFRVNTYFQRGTIGAAFRLIPAETVPIERAAAGDPRLRAQPARHRVRDRPDGLGQVDDARLDHQRDRRDARRAHHDDRGPDRVPPPPQEVHRQPARARRRRQVVRDGFEGRPAPGPRRDPRRRDARHGDDRDGPEHSPRPATCWSSRRSTPRTRRRPSTASSTSSRRPSRARSARSSRSASRGSWPADAEQADGAARPPRRSSCPRPACAT